MPLDTDVAAKASKGAAQLHKPFKEVIHEALRVGLAEILAPPTAKPYRTDPRPLGLHELACFAYERAIRLAKKAQCDYIALAQMCQQSQFFQRALLVAEEGLQAYPDCTELQKAIKHASLALSLAAEGPFSKKI